MHTTLTLGPILFHWPAEKKRDFYFKIADESPVKTVYVGEVVCSKRTPFFEKYLSQVIERLKQANKTVVLSSLAEIMLSQERKATKKICQENNMLVEANDAAALYHLKGIPHHVGPFFNTYNEDTLSFLAAQGAVHCTLPPEIPATSLSVLAPKAQALGITLEIQVYGRTGLALSARCYHARAHGRIKANCQFVCGEDPDGMELQTLSNQSFLIVNGIQTMSHTYLNLIQEIDQLKNLGVSAFRLSPHTHDMVQVSKIFQDVLDQKIEAPEGLSKLSSLLGEQDAFSNGFYYKKAGHRYINSHKQNNNEDISEG